MKVYLIGSLRNPKVPKLASRLRQEGYEVFDDWYAVGPEADDYWQAYETARGRSYKEALKGYAGRNTYDFDHRHLCEADLGVMLMPAGKSAHLEVGFLAGQGKPTFVLFDEIPERYDVMYQFCTAVCFSEEELLNELVDTRYRKED